MGQVLGGTRDGKRKMRTNVEIRRRRPTERAGPGGRAVPRRRRRRRRRRRQHVVGSDRSVAVE